MRSEGYGSWFICLSDDAYSVTTGYEAAYQRLQNYASQKKSYFPEKTAFERYAVKTSEKANMQNRTADPLAVYLGGSGSHNVSSPACHLVL